MLVADVPIVFLGERASLKIPFSYVRYVAASLFAAMGIMALAGVPVLDLAGR